MPDAQSPASRPARAKNILLVEDHPDTLLGVQKLLQANGYNVTTAGDVKSALESGRAIRFDLLIADIGLPDGDGRKVLAELRKLYPLVGIALSAYGMKDDFERTARMGFQAHILKPATIETLREAIEKAVSSPASSNT
jgi:CheY-like chemotaxis protein